MKSPDDEPLDPQPDGDSAPDPGSSDTPRPGGNGDADAEGDADTEEGADGDANSSANEWSATPGRLTEEYNSTLHVAQLLEDFLPHVYKANFRTTDAVLCSITPTNKLEITSIADIKVLAECNIFSHHEIRKMVAFAPTCAKHA